MPRRVVLAVGGFDPRFKWGHEGADLTHRILLHGYRLRYNADVAITHHQLGSKLRPEFDKAECYRLLFFLKYNALRKLSLAYELRRIFDHLRRGSASRCAVSAASLLALPWVSLWAKTKSRSYAPTIHE
jgi:GT2 family glycosyltransferase